MLASLSSRRGVVGFAATVVATNALLLPALTTGFSGGPAGAVLQTAALVVVLATVPVALASVRWAPARAHPAPLVLAAASAVAVTIAFAFHPSDRGIPLLLGAWGGAGAAVLVAAIGPRRLRLAVAAPLLASAGIQGGVMALQWVTGTPSIARWFDPSASLETIDGFLRPMGTMGHVYEPAVLALVAIGVAAVSLDRGPTLPWTLGLVAASWAVALSHSRAGLVGVAGVAVVAAWSRRRGEGPAMRRVVVVAVSGFLLGVLLGASGWSIRWEQTATGDLDDASLGRVTLARQAVEVVAVAPLTGVGPGGYLPTLDRLGIADPDHPFAAHAVPLVWLAELGLPLGALLVGLAGWVVAAAIRNGPPATLLLVAPAGFFLFDLNLYDRIGGLVLFG
ncbi:MAG TPA: O-antigen ligase domain-containing protein, partial [Actinobacteria bacterium]|nr:O-antigen ligase domain-containing protein [Actinomycetota bacterium]